MPGRSGNMPAFVNVVPPPIADAIGILPRRRSGGGTLPGCPLDKCFTCRYHKKERRISLIKIYASLSAGALHVCVARQTTLIRQIA
jgi:hypothetical protein